MIDTIKSDRMKILTLDASYYYIVFLKTQKQCQYNVCKIITTIISNGIEWNYNWEAEDEEEEEKNRLQSAVIGLLL